MKTSRHRLPFISRGGRSTSHLQQGSTSHRRLRFESLEERRMLAVITVNSTSDVALRGAIESANAAPDADEIHLIASGVISLTEGELFITAPVTIVGPGSEYLTIDAHGGSRIFNIDDGTAGLIDVTISGVTLTGGKVADGADGLVEESGESGESGGGIFSLENLTIENSVITGNSSGSGGDAGDPTVVFQYSDGPDGGPGGSGGGIYSMYGDLVVVDSAITNNRTGSGGNGGDIVLFQQIAGEGYAGGNGGGIFFQGQNLTIVRSSISDNRTGEGGDGGDGPSQFNAGFGNRGGRGGDGGGIYASGIVTIEDSTISGNQAGKGGSGGKTNRVSTYQYGPIVSSQGGDGGGLKLSGSATIQRTTINDNIAGAGGDGKQGLITAEGLPAGEGGHGGGISSSSGNVTLLQSTISNNNAGRGGKGGMGADGMVVPDRPLAPFLPADGGPGGDGGGGGGISLFNSVLSVRHSTITGNSAGLAGSGGSRGIGIPGLPDALAGASGGSGSGGGLFVDEMMYFTQQSTISLDHTILAGNNAANGSNFFFEDTNVSFDTDFSLIDDDARLGPLADNGGLTRTHMPLSNFIVVGAGKGDISGAPEYDQRGFAFARIVGSQIDIGAVEFEATSANFDYDNDVDGSDFLAWQRGFGTTSTTHSIGDATIDGSVDAEDLSIWLNTFGTTSSTPPASASSLSPATGNRADFIDAAFALVGLSFQPDDDAIPIADEPFVQPLIARRETIASTSFVTNEYETDILVTSTEEQKPGRLAQLKDKLLGEEKESELFN